MEKKENTWTKFFMGKLFYKHLFLSVLFVLSIVFLILFFLKLYTRHDKLIELPDFKVYQISEVDSIFDELSLRYIVIDSIYNDNLLPQSIVDQDPKPGSFVKENRRVYFTVVSKNKKRVKVPNLIDLTLRRATSKLLNSGLSLGELKYVPDMAKNAVLKQMFEGNEIKEGEILPAGSKIDLEIGDGLSDVVVELPDLTGLTLEDAELVLKMRSLKIGLALFNEDVIDSSTAIIYNQIPSISDLEVINLGRNIDVYLKPNNSDE